jgi:hypothetical protein
MKKLCTAKLSYLTIIGHILSDIETNLTTKKYGWTIGEFENVRFLPGN